MFSGLAAREEAFGRVADIEANVGAGLEALVEEGMTVSKAGSCARCRRPNFIASFVCGARRKRRMNRLRRIEGENLGAM